MIRYNDPFLRAVPLRRLLDRMFEDMAHLNAIESQAGASRGQESQTIPVNVFQTPEQIVLVAPMPGLHPNDIEIQVTGDAVYLRAELRGPHQEEKDYIVHEWSYGPYERTVRLPCGVDAERANASFDNGLLVLSLPKRDVTRAHRVLLTGGNAPRGMQMTHSGHDSVQEDGTGGHVASGSGSTGRGATASGSSGSGSSGETSMSGDGSSSSNPTPVPVSGGSSSHGSNGGSVPTASSATADAASGAAKSPTTGASSGRTSSAKTPRSSGSKGAGAASSGKKA